jgi:hypothetical protein
MYRVSKSALNRYRVICVEKVQGTLYVLNCSLQRVVLTFIGPSIRNCLCSVYGTITFLKKLHFTIMAVFYVAQELNTRQLQSCQYLNPTTSDNGMSKII